MPECNLHAEDVLGAETFQNLVHMDSRGDPDGGWLALLEMSTAAAMGAPQLLPMIDYVRNCVAQYNADDRSLAFLMTLNCLTTHGM